jgi:hypothetical protein
MEAIMGSIDAAMVHTCQVLRDTGTTQDSAGEHIPDLVPTDSVCLFEKMSTAGNYISDTDAGKVIVSSIIVSLPDDAVVQTGDFVSTTEPNWAGTYEVQDVDAPEIPNTHIVDHKIAFLKKVGKRG